MEDCTRISSPRRFNPTLPSAIHVTFFLVTAFLSIALTTSPGCQTEKPLRALETFDDVYEQRASLRDSVVTLTGRFMGWNGADCIFPSYAARQATRSDWIFMVGDRCLYVTGGSPPGLSAMEADSAGTQIVLEARLQVNPDEQLLLEYVNSEPFSQ